MRNRENSKKEGREQKIKEKAWRKGAGAWKIRKFRGLDHKGFKNKRFWRQRIETKANQQKKNEMKKSDENDNKGNTDMKQDQYSKIVSYIT